MSSTAEFFLIIFLPTADQKRYGVDTIKTFLVLRVRAYRTILLESCLPNQRGELIVTKAHKQKQKNAHTLTPTYDTTRDRKEN